MTGIDSDASDGDVLRIVLRPHLERGGFHTDRFDTFLGDELVSTSRSGWHDPARELLARGFDPSTTMVVHHAGRPPDPTIKPQPIGELARWTVEDLNHGGLRKVRWRPYPGKEPEWWKGD